MRAMASSIWERPRGVMKGVGLLNRRHELLGTELCGGGDNYAGGNRVELVG